MLGIQLSIGALNDAVDAPLDAVEKPRKPVPAGLVARSTALRIAVLAGAAGLALSAPSGAATVVVAGTGAALGYLYDLRLSRTPLSWLPLALALPLLPVHAWLGVTGTIPPGLLTLVPTAGLAGAGLALANGLVDAERDARTGRLGAVVVVGRQRAWLGHAIVMLAVAAAAVFVAPPVLEAGYLATLRSGGVVLGAAALGLGAAALAARSATIRERGWELEAIGILAIGLAWLAGTAASADAPHLTLVLGP
jgi:4-hydroxybenzoate polyprenyltransferase